MKLKQEQVVKVEFNLNSIERWEEGKPIFKEIPDGFIEVIAKIDEHKYTFRVEGKVTKNEFR